MLGVASGALINWVVKGAIGLLVGRLLMLQYREVKERALQWWHYLLTILTIFSALIVVVFYLGSYMWGKILAIWISVDTSLGILVDGITLREKILGGLLGSMALIWVFKWLAPLLGLEDNCHYLSYMVSMNFSYFSLGLTSPPQSVPRYLVYAFYYLLQSLIIFLFLADSSFF
jgi:hypothetical protein